MNYDGQRSGVSHERNRQPRGFDFGPSGECVCPKCGNRVPHQRGVPCYQQKCPRCGSLLTRTARTDKN